MPNSEHLAILQQGVKVWNEWRDKNPSIRPDLRKMQFALVALDEVNFSEAMLSESRFTTLNPFEDGEKSESSEPLIIYTSRLIGADLRDADLRFTSLFGVDLRFAKLSNAILALADLTRANLTGANLRGAQLVLANLTAADLSNANLSETLLLGSNFSGTVLKNADLSKARIGGTVFSHLDLSQTQGLESVTHQAPSTIGVETIYRSNGQIPESFLRGCGVPEVLLELCRSVAERPCHFFSCFISHSTKDKRFCERLYADMKGKGVRVWYFPEDAKWGESVWGEIDRSIRSYDKLVVVCSKNALTSGPVLREIERALNREDKEGKNILFPITLDDYVFVGWEHPRKADVLGKVVGDFRGWNRNEAEYNAALGKLLEALRANG